MFHAFCDDQNSDDPLLNSVEQVVVAAAEVAPLTRVGTVNVLGIKSYQVGAELLLIELALAAGMTGGALMTVIRTATGKDEGTSWPYVRWRAGGALAVVSYLLIRGALLNFGAD